MIGVELKKELVEHVRTKLPQDAVDNSIRLVHGDSTKRTTFNRVMETLRELGSEYAQFAVLHPPYADIIQFSDLESDLSNCSDTEDFLRRFRLVARSAFDTLEPGRDVYKRQPS